MKRIILAVIAALTLALSTAAASPSVTPTWGPETGIHATLDTAGGANANGQQFDLNNNMWSCADQNCNGMVQSIWSTGAVGSQYAHWGTTANVQLSDDQTSVKTYPEVEWPYYKGDTSKQTFYPAISALKSVRSTYNITMPPSSATYDAEAAYDLWVDTGAGPWTNPIEVMIWVDNHGQRPAGNVVAHLKQNKVAWTLWDEGGTSSPSQPFSFVMNSNSASSTVHILDLLRYLINHNYIPANVHFDSAQFGIEWCSTGGQTLEFDVNNYSYITGF